MRNRNAARLVGMAAAALLLCIPANAYYHYVYYNGRTAPFTPIRAQFNWIMLPNNTLNFYVNDQGPSIYAPNVSSFGSVLGEIKQAIAAWNSVSTSNLRVGFGGVESAPTGGTPAADVVFSSDLPPGLAAMTMVNLPAIPTFLNGPTGQFVPIMRSTVVFNSDMTQLPSTSEVFFTTAVHEVGHALGLQHTWTGAAMSQGVVRNTSRTRPIDADDRAALSVLYGSPNWAAGYGAISGRVTFSGSTQGVGLASVVALPTSGPAVSALTDPNGNYTINGLPTNTSYMLYVHPLPPNAIPLSGEGIQLPMDQAGRTFPASGAFQTVFYPGTLDPNQAQTLVVPSVGASFTANFSVRPQPAPTMYEVATYSYLDPATRDYSANPPANYKVSPVAFLNATQPQSLFKAVFAPVIAPQSVTVLGGFAPAQQCDRFSPCYRTDVAGLFAYVVPPLGAGSGPRPVLFNTGNDMYVLPGGVSLVQKGPPAIDSVTPNADGTVSITGTGFGADTTVYFESLPAAGIFNGNTISVTPPAGTSGQVASIAVYNSDGQNSLALQSGTLPTYTYGTVGAGSFTVNPPSIPAGTLTAMVDITGVNTRFVDGQVTVGFGTSDVLVSRVWVLSPTHLLANIVVAPNASVGPSEISVISGFQVMTQPGGFQVTPGNPILPTVAAVVNWAQGQATIYPGATVSIYGANLAGAQVTLNGQPIPLLGAVANQINVILPAGVATGPSVLVVNTSGGSASVVVPISTQPPSITGVTNFSNVTVDGTHAANIGDILYVQVIGLDPGVIANPSRLKVTVAGASMTILTQQLTPTQIPIVLGQSFGGSTVPVVVVVDGSASNPFTILAR